MRKQPLLTLDHLSIIICSLLILPLTVWIIIMPITKSLTYYQYEFKKYEIADSLTWEYEDVVDNETIVRTISYTDDDLQKIMKQLINYLTKDEQTPQVYINDLEVFSNQALKHLEDVKDLYYKGNLSCTILLFIFIASLSYLIYRFKHLKHLLKKNIIITSLVIIGIILIIIILTLIDFDQLFTLFHHLIFPDETKFNDAFFGSVSNYPEKIYVNNEFLVDMLNLDIFKDIAFIILAGCVITYAIWCEFGLINSTNYKKKTDYHE